MTPEEEIEEKIVLALLGEYAAAQVELRQAEALVAFAAKGARETGRPSLVHRQFLAEDKLVATKKAARKAGGRYHLKNEEQGVPATHPGTLTDSFSVAMDEETELN